MAETEEVSFVMAFPGWEVLYYFKGGRFESAPIVAWATHVLEGTFVRASPVTTDLAWSIDDDRPICTPDGDVTLGELEHWPSVWAWLEDMKRREAEEKPSTLSTAGIKRDDAPIELEGYRRRFQEKNTS